VGILCIASKNFGTLPSDEDIAVLLRTRLKKAAAAMADLASAGLIDDFPNGRRPHNWDARQYKDDSKERVRRHRERYSNRYSNAPESESTETETEPERELKSPTAHSSSLKTKWPEGFQLKPEHIAYAASKNINSEQAEIAFGKFANHHRAKGSEFSDWDFAWRLWVDREIQFTKPVDRSFIDGRL
jgi:hypothetical protein